jgi:hypothetical protein
MNCTEVKEVLSSFNDHEATPEEVHAVEEHLLSCKDCAFESTMIVGMKRLLSHWDGVRASDRFHADLMERVGREPRPGILSRLTWRPVWTGLGAGAAAAVVAVVLWYVIPGSGDGDGTGVAEERSAVSAPGGVTPPAAGPAEDRGEPLARVVVLQGTLRIGRSDGPESLGSVGDTLSSGDSVRISSNGAVEIELVEGLTLHLEGDAEYVIGERTSEGELRAGTLFLRDSGAAGDDAAYSVVGLEAVVSFEKRGLLAGLALRPDGEVDVTVAGGRAKVMLPSGMRDVGPGEALGVAADGGSVSPPAAEEALARLRRWGKR